MALRVTAMLPDEPPQEVRRGTIGSNKHHHVAPVHDTDVQTYLKSHPAAKLPELPPDPIRPDEATIVAATSTRDDDPTRRTADYVELIGTHRRPLDTIMHSEPRLTFFVYGLIVLGVGMVMWQFLIPMIPSVLFVGTGVAAISAGAVLHATKTKDTALKILLVLCGISTVWLLFLLYTQSFATIFPLVLTAYTLAVIRDVNDVA
jgi:hypothetical protein